MLMNLLLCASSWTPSGPAEQCCPVFCPLQTFAEDPKLLVLLAQMLQQELGATLAALPASELSSNSDRQQQLRAAAKDAGISAADSWDLGDTAVGEISLC
jgi:hypothetical protein